MTQFKPKEYRLATIEDLLKPDAELVLVDTEINLEPAIAPSWTGADQVRIVEVGTEEFFYRRSSRPSRIVHAPLNWVLRPTTGPVAFFIKKGEDG